MTISRMTWLASLLLFSLPVGAVPPADPALAFKEIASDLPHPWSLKFAPDGRLFFTTRNGPWVGALDLQSKKVTRLGTVPNVRMEGEGGLLGMELDPGFIENRTLYLCYSTWRAKKPVNRVGKFQVTETGLKEVAEYLEAPGATYHNGCRIVASPRGFLYISMGEAGDKPKAQDLKSNSGKIFRLTMSGAIPKDNPFPNSPIWTYGHRNPQGLAFRPGTEDLWSTEHGPDTNDELNHIQKGKNYGWPNCVGEDRCGKDYEPAVRAFTKTSTIAISNLIFYNDAAFPGWSEQILFVSLKAGRLYRVKLAGDRVEEEKVLIDDEFGRLRDLASGPDGLVYIATENSILQMSRK